MSNVINLYEVVDIGTTPPPTVIRVKHHSKMEFTGGVPSTSIVIDEYVNLKVLPKELRQQVIRAVQFAQSAI